MRWGVLFDLLGGIMGMVIMAVLANLAASGVMSLVNLTLFLLLWSIPSLLLSGWPKMSENPILQILSRGLPAWTLPLQEGVFVIPKDTAPFPLRGIGVPLRRYSLAFRALITQSPSKVRPGGRRELRPTPLRAHSVRPYSICAPFWQINGVGFRCTPMPREREFTLLSASTEPPLPDRCLRLPL